MRSLCALNKLVNRVQPNFNQLVFMFHYFWVFFKGGARPLIMIWRKLFSSIGKCKLLFNMRQFSPFHFSVRTQKNPLLMSLCSIHVLCVYTKRNSTKLVKNEITVLIRHWTSWMQYAVNPGKVSVFALPPSGIYFSTYNNSCSCCVSAFG